MTTDRRNFLIAPDDQIMAAALSDLSQVSRTAQGGPQRAQLGAALTESVPLAFPADVTGSTGIRRGLGQPDRAWTGVCSMPDTATRTRPVAVPPAQAAFFDVDETLISVKSMLRFLDFYLTAVGEEPGTYLRLKAELGALVRRGTPREEVNRAYYRYYAGQSARRLARVGRDWARSAAAEAGFWHTGPLLEHTVHRSRSAPTVLLSGSFFACLEPLAEELGATEVHGTPVLIDNGVLTGEIGTPMIGAGKARAAREAAVRLDLELERCSAYADHISDLPLLNSVGDPVAVGADPELRAVAEHRGWRVIPVTASR